jgi:hypothetical protein
VKGHQEGSEGERPAQLECSKTGPVTEGKAGPGKRCPQREQMLPCRQQERSRQTSAVMHSAYCWRSSLWTSGTASFPFIRHCETIPLSMYFFNISICLSAHYFVAGTKYAVDHETQLLYENQGVCCTTEQGQQPKLLVPLG